MNENARNECILQQLVCYCDHIPKWWFPIKRIPLCNEKMPCNVYLIDFISIMNQCTLWSIRTRPEKINKMTLLPYRKCNIWQKCTAEVSKDKIRQTHKQQHTHIYWIVQLFRLLFYMQFLNSLLLNEWLHNNSIRQFAWRR